MRLLAIDFASIVLLAIARLATTFDRFADFESFIDFDSFMLAVTGSEDAIFVDGAELAAELDFVDFKPLTSDFFWIAMTFSFCLLCSR
jgi:hypothetical protein